MWGKDIAFLAQGSRRLGQGERHRRKDVHTTRVDQSRPGSYGLTGARRSALACRSTRAPAQGDVPSPQTAPCSDRFRHHKGHTSHRFPTYKGDMRQSCIRAEP